MRRNRTFKPLKAVKPAKFNFDKPLKEQPKFPLAEPPYIFDHGWGLKYDNERDDPVNCHLRDFIVFRHELPESPPVFAMWQNEGLWWTDDWWTFLKWYQTTNKILCLDASSEVVVFTMFVVLSL